MHWYKRTNSNGITHSAITVYLLFGDGIKHKLGFKIRLYM